jgi:hypothetical protein
MKRVFVLEDPDDGRAWVINGPAKGMWRAAFGAPWVLPPPGWAPPSAYDISDNFREITSERAEELAAAALAAARAAS